MQSMFTGIKSLGLLALVASCGGAPDLGAAAPVAAQGQAVTTASTTDVVNSIIAAARQLQAATANMNAVLAGAYSVWPSRAEFERAQTVRGYSSDWAALNAVTFVAAAYAQGAYVNPSLNWTERQQLAGAYASSISPAGAYVQGGSFSGAYVLPTGGVGGAYVSGAGLAGIAERVNRLARE